MWGLFKTDPRNQFGYQIGDKIGDAYVDDHSLFCVHEGKRKSTIGEVVTLFICDLNRNSSLTLAQLESAKFAVRSLKMLKHPSILTYLDSIESDQSVLLATEYVEPLMINLASCKSSSSKGRAYYIAWGLFQIVRGLCFLHDSASLTHDNLSASCVFVNNSGEWKLFGLHRLQNINASTEMPSRLASNEKYRPPTDSSQNFPFAEDAWGLGCIIWEIFNGYLTTASDLARLGSIPQILHDTYNELVSSKPNRRPLMKAVLEKMRSNGYFKNPLINVLLFLEELQIKEDRDKSLFYSSLSAQLDNFPAIICSNKILPELVSAYTFGNAGSSILPAVFKLGKNLQSAEYQEKIVPCLIKLFQSNDRNARFKLLTQLESFVEHLNEKMVNEQVFPQLVNGFVDTETVIREKTVIAMIHLAPKLSYANLDEVSVMKHFTRLLRDENGGIRTNTTVCLGKIAKYLHPSTRQKCLFTSFSAKLKDPFPPARIAAINSLAATQEFYTIADTSGRILPAICTLMADPEKPVRDRAFKVGRGFTDNLERVSIDPTLREEMEREVNTKFRPGSALSKVASGWATWAVCAIGATFYKSEALDKKIALGEVQNGAMDSELPIRKSEPLDQQLNQPKTEKSVSKSQVVASQNEKDGWSFDDETVESPEAMFTQPALKLAVQIETKQRQKREKKETKVVASSGPMKLGAKKIDIKEEDFFESFNL